MTLKYSLAPTALLLSCLFLAIQPAQAQRNNQQFGSNAEQQKFCQSPGQNYQDCMRRFDMMERTPGTQGSSNWERERWERQRERERYERRDNRDNRDWNNNRSDNDGYNRDRRENNTYIYIQPRPQYPQSNYPYQQQRLTPTQERALQNCQLAPPHTQEICRNAVLNSR